MTLPLAVGVPHELISGRWDWTPLLVAVVVLVLIRFAVGMRMRLATVALAALLGALWVSLAGRWGILPVALAGAVVLGGAAGIARRLRHT